MLDLDVTHDDYNTLHTIYEKLKKELDGANEKIAELEQHKDYTDRKLTAFNELYAVVKGDMHTMYNIALKSAKKK